MANDGTPSAHVERASVPKLALTVREAGEALGLSPRSVQELVAAGAIPVVRHGRRVLIPVEPLRDWLRRRSIEPSDTDGTSG
jgi:excisionase family DNA binding protein